MRFRTIALVLLVIMITVAGDAQQRFQARPAAADTSIAARLERLEDMEEIRTLLLDYGRFLDSRDLVAYSRLFAKDGEWVGGFGADGKPVISQAGRYDDVLVRENGRWKFKRRVASNDIPAPK